VFIKEGGGREERDLRHLSAGVIAELVKATMPRLEEEAEERAHHRRGQRV